MTDNKMKMILENMQVMLTMLETNAREHVGPGMDMSMEGSDQPNFEGESEGMNESLSQGAIDKLLDAMLLSPRMDKMMDRYGLDDLSAERLRVYLIPVMKMFFASEGIGVTGVSSAQAAIRAFGRR